MNAFMIQQATSVGVQARNERALDTLRHRRPVNRSARRTLGAALVAIGQRVSGEMPAARTARPDGDRL